LQKKELQKKESRKEELITDKPIRVLFVCLGNICRSPTAHGLFQALVNRENLQDNIIVDSAGTGSWHIGHSPDKRAQQTALGQGCDISQLRSRVVTVDDFSTFDYVLAMDQDNFKHLAMMKPKNYQGVLGLFLTEADIVQVDEVPDPYYGNEKNFEQAMALIQRGVTGLMSRIKNNHKL
jgi:protein-tyrosine phosphatase